MKRKRTMITSLLCLMIVSCISQQVIVIPTPTNPEPTIASFPTPDTQGVFIQTSIKQNYRVFGDLYMMDGCPHSGKFGVRLSSSANLPSWWGIVFYEPYDISKYQSLNFWVKGDSGDENFLVLIENGAGSDIEIKSSSLNVTVSDLEWRLVEVPFNPSTFGTDSVTEIKSFVIGVTPSDQIESICIDDVYLSIQAD